MEKFEKSSVDEHKQCGASSLAPPPPYEEAIEQPLPLNSTDDREIFDQALEFTSHQPTPNVKSTSVRLSQPVVIPQVTNGLGLPFVRANSPVLEQFDVSAKDFLEFVDNLNVVSTASPPLQVLDLAGSIVGMVPLHIPQLVGGALNITAKLGIAAVSKGRSSVFMERANKDFFGPRGLKVQIATTQALKVKLGMDPEKSLVQPLSAGESSTMDVQGRRMLALQGRVAPLTFDVPPPSEQTNRLEQLSAGQVKRQVAKAEKKAMKDRGKAMDMAVERTDEGEGSTPQGELDRGMSKIDRDRQKAQEEYDKEMQKIQNDDKKASRKAEKAQRELDREMHKLDRKDHKATRDHRKESKKHSKDLGKGDKEIKMGEKVLWLLIESIA